MKLGILINKHAKNLGDDIQSYAAAKLLPRVDYAIDREHIDTFSSKHNEPVAVLMNGWWMWRKWNWPPADCIIPKLTSMHINTYTVTQLGTPLHTEWLTGCGREYMQKYGPVGCRDHSTIAFLKEAGIKGYFSGCLTLTLPEQPKTPDAGTYVCLVDLHPKLEAEVRKRLADTGLEIRAFSHDYDDRPVGQSLKQRFDNVEKILTQYQNARFVVTRRLHVTLPCIALKTPVLSLVNKNNVKNSSRWDSYADLLHYVDESDFLSGNYDFDFHNPPPNRDAYLPIRESLIREVQAFVQQYQDVSCTLEEVRKTSYTEAEKLLWQNQMMKTALDKWMHANKRIIDHKSTLRKKLKQTAKTLKQYAQFIERLQADGVITEVSLPEVSDPVISDYEEDTKSASFWGRLRKAIRAFRN